MSRADLKIANAKWLGRSYGALDIMVAFTYLFSFDNSIYYAIGIGLKILLAIRLSSEHGVRLELRNVLLVSTLILSMFVALYQREVAVVTVIQLTGFIGHLYLSGTYIRRREYPAYVTAISVLTALIIALYLILLYSDQIPTVFGRYQFFGGSHPNLGGEIIAAGVFVAGMKLRPNRFLMLSAISILPLFYLQSRAALIFVLFLQCVCVYYSYVRNGSRVVQAGSLLLAFGGAVVLAFNINVLSDVFLLNDPYRGVGTGFVGRDTRWQSAFEAFYGSPIFGNGYGYFDSNRSAGAHNFFLFALAENGIFSLIIVGWIFYGIFRFGLSRRRELFWFMSFLMLAWFNDRFANLNPFPFLFYVFMWMDSRIITINCLRALDAGSKSRRETSGLSWSIGAPNGSLSATRK